jgi:hypothetical protein
MIWILGGEETTAPRCDLGHGSRFDNPEEKDCAKWEQDEEREVSEDNREFEEQR